MYLWHRCGDSFSCIQLQWASHMPGFPLWPVDGLWVSVRPLMPACSTIVSSIPVKVIMWICQGDPIIPVLCEAFITEWEFMSFLAHLMPTLWLGSCTLALFTAPHFCMPILIVFFVSCYRLASSPFFHIFFIPTSLFSSIFIVSFFIEFLCQFSTCCPHLFSPYFLTSYYQNWTPSCTWDRSDSSF